MANAILAISYLVLVFLSFKRPGVACGITLSMYSLEQWAQASGTLAATIPSLINYMVVGLIVIASGAQLARHGAGQLKLGPPAILALALLAYCYASVSWSLFPSTSLGRLSSALPYLVAFVGLAPLTIHSERDIADCLTSLVFAGLISLGALLLFGRWEGRGVVLPAGYQGNPLATAEVAGAILITGILSLRALVPSRIPRTALIILVLVTSLFIFLRSGSRGQVIAAVAAVLIFRGAARPAFILGAVLVLLGLSWGGVLEDEVARNSDRWETEQVSAAYSSGRLGTAEQLLDFWSRRTPFHIVFGVGQAVAQDPRVLGSYPHVVPLEVLAEEGLVGFTIYCFLIVSSVIAYRNALRDNDIGAPLVRTAAALAFFFTVITLKQGSLLHAHMSFLLLTLSTRLQRDGAHYQSATEPSPHRASLQASTGDV